MAKNDPTLSVDVANLKALHKALKQADPELQKQLRRDLKKAADIVANEAKTRVPSRTGRAAASIRTGSNTKGAYIAGGGTNAVKYYGWLDFGSRTPKKQRGPWRGSGSGPHGGRFIYPALADRRDEVMGVVEDAVAKSIKEAGF